MGRPRTILWETRGYTYHAFKVPLKVEDGLGGHILIEILNAAITLALENE